MPRSDLFRPTFRLKLLLALIGTIAPLLLVTLLVVRREADRQVDAVVQSTVTRAGEVFAQIEKIRQGQLEQLAYRSANGNRVSAALQQALEGDTTFLIDQTLYELGLAGYPDALAAYTNLAAEPLAAVVEGHPVANPAAAVASAAIDRLFAGDTAVFGYHLLDNRIFSVHPIVLVLVTEPVGIMQLGFAIDDETARSLGQALGADVCFVANQQCVASSTGAAMHELETFASARDAVEHIKLNGHEYAKVSRPLNAAGQTGTQIVLRVPLDEVVRPFSKILQAIRWIGLAVLLMAIIVAIILSRGMAEPVRALVGATVRVARGDYQARVPVNSKDEIGQLAAAFNEMTHGLQLKEQYRGVLDKVVSRDVADEMLKGEIQLGGETREVTTLFADIREFTAMSEGMAPHDVIALLNEVMERAEEAVVAEGGVVDKYVGDEIMALFGAPIARGDDALRAIRAAVRIQQEMAEMNERRTPPGRDPVTLGIGINTGEVVAGNMGSARRLNYTVLGTPVNLAARLCSQAEGNQILISETTLDRVRDHVQVRPLGMRMMKGISRPVPTYQVTALESEPAVAATVRGFIIGALLLVASAGSAFAQRTWTLGPVQVQPSARVDVLGFVPDTFPAFLIPENDPFVAGRASAYFDVFAGERLYGLVELRLDRGDAPSNRGTDFRIEQAFARFTPFRKIDLSLQAGRFVNPFGNYPQRHHSSSDPLIRPPLTYDYRTMICDYIVAENRTDFIDWKDAPSFWRPIGLPAVWAAPYQLGAMALGSFGPVNYRLALMNGAPSAEPDLWNQWPKQLNLWSYVVNVGVQVTPELRVGASYDNGPYLDPAIQGLPAGWSLADYYQKLLGFEAAFTRGRVELRGEFVHDVWEVPTVTGEHAIDTSYYIESRVKLGVGLFASARYGEIRFNELTKDDGTLSPWDYDTRRIQLGAGYRISQPLEIRGELMLNDSEVLDPSDNLFSVQLSWTLN